ncbi:AAA family ATPase [Salegentibacter mishustinae]|uniref:ATPase AAA-type core domain-containing protein n=1 Tax=Salegentibacter mishustinae TaxID=270918 RepID=A0A0Q9Z7Y1_9FLAO|nr:AAA family ATPase [Salegentibacter mishustinae]KRG29030.1 hypothetical protein APR42_03635 [Salegentibacter mishustinae]PNW21918.1 hypothetical protein APB85_11855 [Salegentibacter mishustinae]PZX65269.1 hypothetical protein LY54_01562 [Salegentibacter mishustinae]GGW86200.1 hypothetical protein GCM10008086_13140 [Salegentibacter mishustinae]
MSNPNIILIYENNDEVIITLNRSLSKPQNTWHKLKFEKEIASIKKGKLETSNHYGYNIWNNLKGPIFTYYNPTSFFNPFLNHQEYKDDRISNYYISKLERGLRLMSNGEIVKNLKLVYPDLPFYQTLMISSNLITDYDLFQAELFLYNTFILNEKTQKIEEVDLQEKIKNGKYKERINFLSEYDNLYKDDFRCLVGEKIYIMSRIISIIEENGHSYQIEEELLSKIKIKDFSSITFLITKLREEILRKTKKKETTATAFIQDGLKLLSMLPENNIINKESLDNLLKKDFFNLKVNLEKNYRSWTSDFKGFKYIEIFTIQPNYSLSQGEEILLDLLAYFHDLDAFQENRYQIILLDEATIGFHPLWQKKFVNAIRKLLPEIFKANLPKTERQEFKQNEIQIIFSTHDPLTLTDLAKENIIYLKKSNNGPSELYTPSQNSNLTRSFGANITDLLSDSFFIEDGLMGDFAKNKIEETIGWLNDKDRDVEKKEKHKKIISLIDEPLLRQKLEDMFFSIFEKELNEQDKKNRLKKMAEQMGLEINFEVE